MQVTREWAMPSPATFSIPPIAAFIRRHLRDGMISADPFARNSTLATYTNDMDMGASSTFHLEAEAFLFALHMESVKLDALLFDPPYSPRQIAEVYAKVGLSVGMRETHNAALYKRVRNAADVIMKPGAVCLSFGWNSAGMGKQRGYRMDEVLLVAHGGAHNDTICVAETKICQS